MESNIKHEIILKKFMNLIKDLFSEYNLTFEKLFMSCNENNKIVNDKIIEFIRNNFESKKDIEDFVNNTLHEHFSFIYYNTSISGVINRYLNYFINYNYLSIDEDKQKDFDDNIVLRYDDDNSKKLNKLKKESKIPLILLQNGDFYIASYFHNDLCAWLLANGIDITGSLRLLCNDNTQLSISSLYNYDYLYSDKNEKSVKITDTQAESLINFYRAMSSDGKIPPEKFRESLLYSSNLNLSPREQIDQNTYYNLDVLSKYLDEDEFDKISYLKEIKYTNSPFTPLN